mgnify:CR=1 FL=1
MFDRFFFSLSMFVFRIFQGLSGGQASAVGAEADDPFYVDSFESFQDFDRDRH